MSNHLLPVSGAKRFVSIVVPTFRREGYLGPLFDALKQQIDQQSDRVEVVLIDNSPEGSAAQAAAGAPEFVRYVHEPKAGVAHARNRGVAEARGTYVIFLDDDELPARGWLTAFAAAADSGVAVAFGAIDPAFEEEPAANLRQPLDRVFSRRLPAAAGADVSALRAYVGSGNSMFRRDVLARVTPPFDPTFNAGGEDVWLFRHLVDDHGIALIWCPDALVHELVPARRATIGFLRSRRFSDGQLRCVVESGAGGLRGAARVAFWMAAGAAQLVLHGIAALALRPFSAALSTRFQLDAVGGAGKLLWWRRKLAR